MAPKQAAEKPTPVEPPKSEDGGEPVDARRGTEPRCGRASMRAAFGTLAIFLLLDRTVRSPRAEVS